MTSFVKRRYVSCLVTVNGLLIVPEGIRPDDGTEKAETCRLIYYILFLCGV